MTTLYKKVGKRYRPVAEHEEWDSYPKGAHLVVCSPGSTLRRFNIDPDHAGLLAAAEPLRAEIRALVMELHRMRPTRRPVTMEQAALVAAAEREACAQLVEKNADVCGPNTMLCDVLRGNAAAIRARGNR